MNTKAYVAAVLAYWAIWSGGAIAQELPPNSLHDPIAFWTFSNTNAWSNNSGHNPISYTNLAVSDLGDGTALVVDSANPAWLRFKVTEDDGATNLVIGRSGSISFWFAATSWSSTNVGGSGPGVWGRLIEAGAYTTNASFGWWSLYTDPWGAGLYFSAQTNNGAQAVYLSAPIAWTTNRWHFVALTYSSTNISLYLDGSLMTNAPGLTIWPPTNALANGICIGSSSDGGNQAHGMFDDLVTYDYVLSAQTISNFFGNNGIEYWGNPLNTANISSAPYDPPVPAPGFRAIMGTGYVHLVSLATNCVTNNTVWMTNFTARLTNNGTMNVRFKIAGGAPGVTYDLFGADGPAGNHISDAQWYWLGQGSACGTYVVTNLPGAAALFALGGPQDSDGDGLTDAFEALVSKTNPQSDDSFGNGWPDWWQFVHFGIGNTVDPYADPDGDGWSNVQEYQNGTDPFSFNTPPPPKNVVFSVDGTGTNVTVTWASGGGPVTNYVVEFGRYGDLNGNSYIPATSVDPTVFNYSAALNHSVSGNGYFETGVRVRAYFPNGQSAVSYRVGASKYEPNLTGDISAIRGPGGHTYLLTSALLPNVASIHMFNDDGEGFNVPASEFTNGIAVLPGDFRFLWAQALTPDGGFGTKIAVLPYKAQESLIYDVTNFINAGTHLKENLKFLLRSASRTRPFAYRSGQLTEVVGVPIPTYDNPESEYLRPAGTTNYEYSGYHTFSPYLNYSFMHEVRPVKENILWSNFVYAAENAGHTGTGYGFYGANNTLARTLNGELYSYAGTGTESVLPFAPLNAGRWLYYAGIDVDNTVTGLSYDVGITTNSSGQFILGTGLSNCFGLKINSAWLEVGGTLLPGIAGATADSDVVTCYVETASPTLAVVDYYFASDTWYLNYYNTGWLGSGPLPGVAPPLPGAPTFSVTNTSPPLITGIAQPITVSGWAKYAISNGYSNHYAYLEQYFDSAYTLGTNGAATTNRAGVLSPYGEFFPTQPGPAALVTLPDIDPPYQRGTGVVNVIKIQLDVNHDGVMDLSFAGPDNTTQDRPYAFWVNNDHDEPSSDGYDIEKSTWGQPPLNRLDSTYGAMRCTRNLEDFARLWVCGLPALPPAKGYAVTFTMYALNGMPSINLYAAVTNSAAYLTSTNAATVQLQTQLYLGDQLMVDYSKKLGTVSSTQNWTLPLNTDGTPQYTNFLFEGTGIGSGELVMSVWQGTNIVAQTSTWLDLKDVGAMFEHVRIDGAPSSPPYLPQTDVSVYYKEDYLPRDTADGNEIIAFVHGWRVSPWESENFTETMFKRLYWQGYHGRYVAVRWPTLSSETDKYGLEYLTFNRDEYIAFKCAKGVADYFVDLHGRFPQHHINVTAHSHGNVLMMEVLKRHLAAGQTAIHNYALLQAAVAAECLDTNAPTFPGFTISYPNSDSFYGYAGPVQNAISGHMANFFNTNDFGVVTAWQPDQLLYKPDGRYYYQYLAGVPTQSPIGSSRTVTDPHELMAFLSRPRTQAVGGMAGLGTPFTTALQVDLAGVAGFGGDWKEHSGEFNYSIQRLQPFYESLLNRLVP
jgi:hypothetical protein